MTKKQTRNMPLGLYKLYWKSGGMSLAAVGQNNDGSRWFAPTNWLGPMITRTRWGLVDRAVLLNVAP